MDCQQPSSGDLRDIQRQHQSDTAEKENSFSSDNNNKSSSSSSSSSSLLERRQSNRLQQEGIQEENGGIVSPMPIGAERMAALRDLGATFEEGQKSIAKVATPTETIVPSFVDSDHLEVRYMNLTREHGE